MFSATLIALVGANTLVGAASSLPSQDALLSRQFDAFAKEHGRVYKDDRTRAIKYETFRDNMMEIEDLNLRANGATFAPNQFFDLNAEERMSALTSPGMGQAMMQRDTPLNPLDLTNVDVVPVIDWRAKGAVSEVKDQVMKKCGSCYAFSATGGIEGANAIASGKNATSLSEEELVDCSGGEGDQGCQGGFYYDAWAYVKANGIASEAAYPYTHENGNCASPLPARADVTVSAWKDVVPVGNETALQQALVLGVVSVAVYCDTWYSWYKSGVYNGTCNNDPNDADHAMLVVGSGHDESSGLDYWLIKNSFGAAWGEEGYLRLAQGWNACGVANFGMQVIV